jgi:uncharacterized protein (TIGR03083 family)
MATIDEQAAAYEASRERIDGLTRSLDDAALATTVPCCPAWSVKDLVGHLTGLLEDRTEGRMPAGGFGEWTAEQVARHRDQPIGAVLDAWRAIDVEKNDAPPSLAALSFDVVTHEHDLRHALGIEGDRASDSVRVGAERAGERMSSMLQGASAPGVIVTTEDGIQLVEGTSDPIALTTTRYGLMRLVTGRVSRAQAEALSWSGDAAPVLDALFADGFFTLQPVDVLEAEPS